MISNSKKSDFLILKGVKLTDFTNKSISSTKPIEKTAVYTDIPTKFTKVDNWPKFSNLKCWECDRLVSGYPKFVPMNIRREFDSTLGEYVDVCDVLGNFDEWSCAVRYIYTELPKNQQPDAIQALLIFESKFTGESKKITIQPSPSKTIMQQYCGNSGITTEEYQKKIIDTANDYKICTSLM